MEGSGRSLSEVSYRRWPYVCGEREDPKALQMIIDDPCFVMGSQSGPGLFKYSPTFVSSGTAREVAVVVSLVFSGLDRESAAESGNERKRIPVS